MQYVQIKDQCSDLRNVICGVPQGSILGPKLFILYINDICNVSNLLKFVLFADDTNIFCSHNDIYSLCRMISNELLKLNVWFAVNKLSLNVNKTNYMLFSNCKINSDLIITINNVNIDRVYVTKFLGVYIDHNLNWKEHIFNISRKLSKSIGIIHKASQMLNTKALYTLYCAIFLPYLNYCSEVWGNTYKSNVTPLFLKQKKVIRIVCKSNFLDHTAGLFYKLKALTLPQIIDFSTGIFMFKAYHKLLPNTLQNFFTLASYDRYNIRQKNNFKQKYVRTKKKQLCISTSGVKLWNSLDDSIKQCKTLSLFKTRYKQKLLSS